ncbi:uncharacterized protein LOC130675810 [Microplitis mediator]|uniref:uncharacterized protein LOC130675810 n=1 Tax=Microplitis mediator TaxID=375433 RepID=UPI002555B721|nr:uncharacterized protein LOC130675810 [Microplitis mediator]
MMLLITLVVITQSFGIQGAVNVVFEDIDCPVYDKEYFLEPEVFVDNHNSLVSNFTIIKLLPEEAQARLAIIGASMGEYVVSTGIDQTMELCDLIEEPIMAGPALKLLGFSEDHCPPEPGNYGTEDYVFTPERLSETTIPNQYLMNMTLSYEDKLLLLCQIFLKAS